MQNKHASQIALLQSWFLLKSNWGRFCSEHCMESMIREGKVKLAATDHVSDMLTFCPIGWKWASVLLQEFFFSGRGWKIVPICKGRRPPGLHTSTYTRKYKNEKGPKDHNMKYDMPWLMWTSTWIPFTTMGRLWSTLTINFSLAMLVALHSILVSWSHSAPVQSFMN